MKKISIDITDKLYNIIRKKSFDETVVQEKFVGMNDILIPIIEKGLEK